MFEPEGDEDVGKVDGVGAESDPEEYAWEATAWRRAEARAGLGEAEAAALRVSGAGICICGVAAGAAPGTGRRNMASMVGRKAAPKGVERKSEGRSVAGFVSVP